VLTGFALTDLGWAFTRAGHLGRRGYRRRDSGRKVTLLTTPTMPWNLPELVCEKAIEIAIALLEDVVEEGKAIRIAKG